MTRNDKELENCFRLKGNTYEFTGTDLKTLGKEDWVINGNDILQSSGAFGKRSILLLKLVAEVLVCSGGERKQEEDETEG